MPINQGNRGAVAEVFPPRGASRESGRRSAPSIMMWQHSLRLVYFARDGDIGRLTHTHKRTHTHNHLRETRPALMPAICEKSITGQRFSKRLCSCLCACSSYTYSHAHTTVCQNLQYPTNNAHEVVWVGGCTCTCDGMYAWNGFLTATVMQKPQHSHMSWLYRDAAWTK